MNLRLWLVLTFTASIGFAAEAAANRTWQEKDGNDVLYFNVQRDPGGRRYQGGKIARAESEFERPFGKVASIRNRGVLVENDLVRRGITATGAIKLRSSFSR